MTCVHFRPVRPPVAVRHALRSGVRSAARGAVRHAVRVAAPVLALLLGGGAADATERQSIEPARITERIREAWAERAPAATLEVLAVPELRHVPGETKVHVDLPEDGLERPGPRALPVSVSVDGRMVARGLANILITVERDVWIATRDLARGETPDEDALRRETRTYERESLRLFQPEPGRRYTLQRDVTAGAIVTTTDMQALPAVAAGAVIHLVSRSGTASVSIPGKARSGGDVGELILVHNPLTGQIVQARLLDEKTALLEPKAASSRKEGRP